MGKIEVEPGMDKSPKSQVSVSNNEKNWLTRPESLQDWIISFACLVIGSLGFVCAFVVLFWPFSAPLTAWEVIAGISSSAVVALVSGMITIVISWETSLHFGNISTSEIAAHLQDSLASTLSSAADFLTAAKEILQQVDSDMQSVLMIAIPNEQLLELHETGGEIAALLRKRFEMDSPTVLILTDENISEGLLWDQLAEVATDVKDFRKRFSRRKSFVISIPIINDALIVHLERTQGTAFNIKASAFAFPVSTAPNTNYAGIRSEVDRGFGRMVLERFCALLQEPASPYSVEVLSASNVLAGQFIGLPVTRSIITSQLLQSAKTARSLEKKDQFWVDITSPSDPNHYMQFLYSSKLFCPPLQSGLNHSGSVIADAIRDSLISVDGLKVWEIGCGPGYVTLQLAEKVGDFGKVLATDIDLKAADIAEKNIKNNKLDSRVTFINGNCLAFKLSVDAGDKVALQDPNGTVHSIDAIFIELPLLPYRGSRSLSSVERGYFEKVPEKYKYMLPPTITSLLSTLGNIRGRNLTVVLPVAGSQSELPALINEIQKLIGDDCIISQLDQNQQDAFISVLKILIK